MKAQAMATTMTIVTTQPATHSRKRRPLTPVSPSHRPTPAIAPTVAGVELRGAEGVQGGVSVELRPGSSRGLLRALPTAKCTAAAGATAALTIWAGYSGRQ